MTTPGGTSNIVRPADAYTYVPPPTVSDVNGFNGLAAAGSLQGGTEVLITGANLATAVGVLFGTTPVVAPNFFVAESGRLLGCFRLQSRRRWPPAQCLFR